MKLSGSLAIVAALAIVGCRPGAGAAEEPASPPAAGQTATAFGVAFDHAAGLQTRPCEADMPRCTILFDPAAEAHMRDLVTIQTHDGALDVVAAAEAGFERNAEGRLMTTYGRGQPNEVEAFEVNGRSGLRSGVVCGIDDPETGFHAAAGECLWAVVSDGTKSVVISSNGYSSGMEAATAVVDSIRFTTD